LLTQAEIVLHRFELIVDSSCLVNFSVDRTMQLEHSVISVAVEEIYGTDDKMQIIVAFNDLAAKTSAYDA
jgi:hypothetical protein